MTIVFGDIDICDNLKNYKTIANDINLELKFKIDKKKDNMLVNINDIINSECKTKKYIVPKSEKKHLDKYKNTSTIKISNITDTLNEEKIKSLFDKYGTIERIKIPKNRNNTGNLGYAFVTYESLEEAKLSVQKMNRFAFENCIVSVEIAK